MNLSQKLKPLITPPADFNARRIGGLRRFAVTITLFTILGHAFLGFEQPIILPIFALMVGYSIELLLELVDAWANQSKPRFLGAGWVGLVDYLLPAHIGSLAISMLIYPNDNLAAIFFAVAVCIASKSIFRMSIGERTQHFFNPSNLGIATTLAWFPYVGLAPPYHFTENLSGAGDWLMVVLIFIAGSLLNTVFTGRIPLIAAWVGTFVLQAIVRSILFDVTLVAALLPVSGLAFVVYTFYMITDPGTTPYKWQTQVIFGASVAIVYGLLVQFHIVFGLFFALTLVSAMRGAGIFLMNMFHKTKRSPVLAPSLAADVPEVRR